MNVTRAMLEGKPAEKPAIVRSSDLLTYGELRGRARRLALGLLARGWDKGERVGLYAENGPFMASAYLGVMRAGMSVVPFQVNCGERMLERIVQACGMRVAFVSRRQRERLQPLADRLGLELLGEDFGDAGEERDWSGADEALYPRVEPTRDLAAIMFTSGSTGDPKGVMVSHRNIEANTRDIVSYLGLTPGDRAMLTLPLYYCFGASILHTHLMAGGSVAISNNFPFPEKFLDELRDLECTGLAGVPSTYQILLRKTRFARRDFPSLRWFQQAGGKLPNPFIVELRQAFPRVQYFLMYGQTEATARLSYLPPERLDDKLGSIGRGLPSTRLEVLREDGTPVRPGPEGVGEIGEIAASGDNITLGYLNDPEETARYFVGGKLRTGDLARVDEEGFIFVVERARDFIKSLGNRVSAKEVEEVICELPQVVEAAVIGAPHEVMGEAIMAVAAATAPGAIDAEAIRLHCAKRLPPFKVPHFVEIVAELPKTGAGKLDKPRLRREAAQTSPASERAPRMETAAADSASTTKAGMEAGGA